MLSWIDPENVYITFQMDMAFAMFQQYLEFTTSSV